MDQFEAPQEPPRRDGPLRWRSRLWNRLLDAGEGDGAGSVAVLELVGAAFVAILAIGVAVYVISS